MTPSHLLLVEDDPDIRAVAALALGSLGGFRVTVAADGHSALAACVEQEPDLLLLDYMLPGMNGMEVLAALRKRGTTAPAILMTASVDVPAAGSSLREDGVIGVIGKPFDAFALAPEIHRLWRHRPSHL